MVREASHVTFSESCSLKMIGMGVFDRFGSFVSLPESVCSIAGSTFSRCPLRDFVSCDTNHFFDGFDGVFVSKDRRVCYSCIGQLKEVIIPDSVEVFLSHTRMSVGVFRVLCLVSLLH